MNKFVLILFSTISFIGALAADLKDDIAGLLYRKADQIAIVEHGGSDDLTELGANSDVYLVEDTRGKVIAVAKVIHGENSREYANLKKLAGERHRNFTTPKPLGIKNLEENTLVLMEPAKGRSLTRILREGDVEECENAVRHIAAALAELHLSSKRLSTRETSYFERNETITRDALELIRGERRHLRISEKKVKAKLAEVTEDLTPLHAARIHGDAHPGNFFYDARTKKVTLIDLGTMTSSPRPTVGGPVALDYVSALASLDATAEYAGLSENDRAHLKTAFKESYSSVYPYLTEEEINYCELIYYLDVMVCFYAFNDTSSELNFQAKTVFNNAKRGLMNLI